MSQGTNSLPTLSYSTPGTRPTASFPLYYVVYLAIVMVPTVLLLGYFILLTPHFQEIFKDFKTTLPAFTEWTLRLAYLVRGGLWIPIVLVALALPVLPAWITVRQIHRPNRVMYVLMGVILMLLCNLIGGIFGVAALFLPLVKLIHSVSGGE